MAILSSDKTYVTVQKGDTLYQIAVDYGNGKTYKQLAAINNISNPHLIYIGQKIKLTSSGGSSTSTSTSSNKATVDHFGLQSNADNVLFASWSWSKSNTASYKVIWYYATGDGIWFVGSNSTNTVDSDAPAASRQSTYSIPSNATKVKFVVKPISKTYTKNNKETNYWTAAWSTEKIHVVTNPPEKPSTPTVEIDKYKLTATIENINASAIHATGVQFQIVKNDTKIFKTGKATINTSTNFVSYSCTVDAGGEYKVRCRSYKGDSYSEWSEYSSNNSTIPSAPAGITNIKANSETSVYLEWSAVTSATSYDIEYTTDKNYFDGSDSTTTISNIEGTHYEKTGLETGDEYFFRVRAVNSKGYSSWSGIKSVIVGSTPSAPTTWSSSTTVVTGEDLTLYWVHNAEDGSSQTYAELELTINGAVETQTIANSTDEDEKDKTSSYVIDTSEYTEGFTIQWRVRTAGITKKYGEWSVQRTIDIYAPPTQELRITDIDGNSIDTLTSFPFYIYVLAGPNTQAPIGYQITITSNSSYETVDSVGNVKMVNVGEEIYSKHFDTSDVLLVEMSASNIDLENNVSYTVTSVVSMNSGLTSEASAELKVAWLDQKYLPNAEIGIDKDTLVAHIRPYCEQSIIEYRKVSQDSSGYVVSSAVIEYVYGDPIYGIKTTTGEQVYSGVDGDGNNVYYCEIETKTLVDDISLSVYRREFDGSFVEIATGLDNSKNTFVTDPHPALDYARYRIVAITNSTGAVSYYDVPGYPVGEHSMIIQWNEDWSNFDTTVDDALEQPAWSGSLLRLPYNVDVSDNNNSDVALIEYIGRKRPVSYYGTQLGETAIWNADVVKSDKETLYALRRLRIWQGDVYVREPSGSGYWANIKVSFSQKHKELTIPVTLDITRVEGGV